MVLNDFQRGKLPYYIKPPGSENEDHPEEESIVGIEENQKQSKKENKKIEKEILISE
jgi:hypothetical protein